MLESGQLPISIRLLHVVHGLPQGGLENGVINLLNHLPAPEFEQAVCCLDVRGEMADRIVPDIPIWVLGRRRHDLSIPWRLGRLIAGWKPDVLHCRNWNSWPDSVLAHGLAGNRGRLVWSFHGFPEGDALPFRRRFASRMLARFTDCLLAVCRDSAERYADQAGIARSRFAVVWNGVDTERFSPPAERTSIRARLNLPLDGTLVVTIASLTPVKDHAALVEAAAEVTRLAPGPVSFLFVGEGPMRDVLQQQIDALELRSVVVLAGKTERVAEYLQAADLFVLPSQLEGMSNAILEAMACGLAVVARRVGGNPELVVDGETGLLTGASDAADLAAAIARLVNDEPLRHAMGRAARQRAEELFSLPAMTAAYAELYRRLVRQGLS